MNNTLPVYQVETCDDINYKTIFSEVKVGESFIVKYNRGTECICERISEWEVFIPADNCHVSVNPGNYNWRAGS